MARIQMPDGGVLDVPEGVDLNTAARAYNAARQRRLADEDTQRVLASGYGKNGGMNPVQRFAVGAITPFAELGYGIKQAVGHLTPEQESQLRAVRQARGDSGTAGTLGEVASFLLPGGAVESGIAKVGAKVLPRATRFAAPVAAGALEQGAYEGARASLEGDPTRGERAAQGALWGGVGAGVGRAAPVAAATALRGVKKAPEATRAVVDQFRRAGIAPRLTLGQALGGNAARIEEGLAALPGSGIPAAREGALTDWNRAQLVNATKGASESAERKLTQSGNLSNLVPPLRARDVPVAGHAGIATVQDQVRRLYDEALTGVRVKVKGRANPFKDTAATVQRLASDDAARIAKHSENLLTDLRKGVGGEKAKEFDSEIRQLASKAFRDGNYELGRAYDTMRKDFARVLRTGMTTEQAARLVQADALYARTVPIQNAAAMQGALSRGGTFTPSQQLSAIRASNPKSVLARGGAPGQADAEAAQQVFSGRIPEVGPGTAEKILTSGLVGGAGAVGLDLLTTGELDAKGMAGYLTPLAAAMFLRSPTAARIALGEAKGQQSALARVGAELARSNAKRITSGGAALATDEE